MSKIKEVTAGKYPADVRETLNQCVKNLNREHKVAYGDVTEPAWQDNGENQQIITLPKGFTGNLTVCVDNGDGADPRYSQKTAKFVQGQLISIS